MCENLNLNSDTFQRLVSTHGDINLNSLAHLRTRCSEVSFCDMMLSIISCYQLYKQDFLLNQIIYFYQILQECLLGSLLPIVYGCFHSDA
jgi:hypothetical protein